MFANITAEIDGVIVVVTEFEYTPKEKSSRTSDGDAEYACPIAGYAFDKESGESRIFSNYIDSVEVDRAIKLYMRK